MPPPTTTTSTTSAIITTPYYIYHFQEQVTWDIAQQLCLQQHGTTLATVLTEDATRDLVTQMTNWNGISVWIGLRDFTQTNKFQWVTTSNTASGEDLVYTNWCHARGGEPSGHEYCVEAYSSIPVGDQCLGRWNDFPCQEHRPFACNTPEPLPPTIPTLTPTMPTFSPSRHPFTTHSPTVPPTYSNTMRFSTSSPTQQQQQDFSEHFFYHLNEKLSWDNALLVCQERYGTSLATVDSKELSVELSTRLSHWNAAISVWIGLRDISHQRKFIWISTNNTITNYNNFCSDRGEPSGNGEYCVEAYNNFGLQKQVCVDKWNDFSCHELKPFVCDRDVRTNSNGGGGGSNSSPEETLPELPSSTGEIMNNYSTGSIVIGTAICSILLLVLIFLVMRLIHLVKNSRYSKYYLGSHSGRVDDVEIALTGGGTTITTITTGEQQDIRYYDEIPPSPFLPPIATTVNNNNHNHYIPIGIPVWGNGGGGKNNTSTSTNSDIVILS
jgi:hypothetical protein